MSRLSDWPAPQVGIPGSVSLHPDWQPLKAERIRADAAIIAWADTMDATWLAGELTWMSRAMNREFTQPRWLLVTHMFNHQTHHRGQVHCMLTQCGGKPHDTDLPFMPE
jgi:uncharacterized damage-inducible protein DinB